MRERAQQKKKKKAQREQRKIVGPVERRAGEGKGARVQKKRRRNLAEGPEKKADEKVIGPWEVEKGPSEAGDPTPGTLVLH